VPYFVEHRLFQRISVKNHDAECHFHIGRLGAGACSITPADDLFDFYFKTTAIVPVVILRVAKHSRRIQTPHGFRDYARNDGLSQ